MRLPSVDAAERLLASAQAEPPGSGEWIGSYELVEEIGRGTHSVVYRARQHDPVAREVAVKVLFDPAEGGSVRARFLRERALLAQVDHPGITQLLECGETESTAMRHALPWFAMPLVAGDTVDRWCTLRGTSRASRLLVLERLAIAVGAAHAAGIVHRDLKPGNVLVSGDARDPRVTVIDFGIAKVLEGELVESRPGRNPGSMVDTRQGSVVGTPEFMSPEQADLDASRVGAASDVYAIGLIASLIFAGQVPGALRLGDGAIPTMGARLRAASAREVGVLSHLAQDRTLRGEVDWIVAKCCARDPQSRYNDARALADDLRRLREGEPIVAAPADSGYAVAFVLRKHKAQLATGSVALVLTLWLLFSFAIREAERANEAVRQREVLSKTLSHVRTALAPITGRGRGDVVNEAEAVPILESMHSLNIALLGAAAPESQQSSLQLVRAYDRVKRYAEAETIYRAMLAEAESNATRLGDQAFLRFMLGGNLRRQGAARISEARELVERAIEYWGGLADPPAIRCSGLAEMGFIAGVEGKLVERERWLAEAIACSEVEHPPGFMRIREYQGFMADHLREGRDFRAARTWYARALDGLETTDPSVQAWIDVWRAELLWIARDEFREGKATFDGAQAAELERLVNEVRRRDPTHPRLERWGE